MDDDRSDPDGRRRAGEHLYARLLDVPDADVSAAMSARVGDAFARETFLAAAGPSSTDPSLNRRERDVAVVAALVAQGVTGDRLETHLVAARRDGLPLETVTALMILLAQYCGYPNASTAMEVVTATWRT